ncbi:hypothetical protein OHV05_35710 (plasmid) [Kitasatospora sp. NBC_00070]|uniref:hypothetical protein n=1 Tax=Kitasatospora sp. NBC_00070 TaxID=2975962 RepID=UPI002F90C76C
MYIDDAQIESFARGICLSVDNNLDHLEPLGGDGLGTFNDAVRAYRECRLGSPEYFFKAYSEAVHRSGIIGDRKATADEILKHELEHFWRNFSVYLPDLRSMGEPGFYETFKVMTAIGSQGEFYFLQQRRDHVESPAVVVGAPNARGFTLLTSMGEDILPLIGSAWGRMTFTRRRGALVPNSLTVEYLAGDTSACDPSVFRNALRDGGSSTTLVGFGGEPASPARARAGDATPPEATPSAPARRESKSGAVHREPPRTERAAPDIPPLGKKQAAQQVPPPSDLAGLKVLAARHRAIKEWQLPKDKKQAASVEEWIALRESASSLDGALELYRRVKTAGAALAGSDLEDTVSGYKSDLIERIHSMLGEKSTAQFPGKASPLEPGAFRYAYLRQRIFLFKDAAALSRERADALTTAGGSTGGAYAIPGEAAGKTAVHLVDGTSERHIDLAVRKLGNSSISFLKGRPSRASLGTTAGTASVEVERVAEHESVSHPVLAEPTLVVGSDERSFEVARPGHYIPLRELTPGEGISEDLIARIAIVMNSGPATIGNAARGLLDILPKDTWAAEWKREVFDDLIGYGLIESGVYQKTPDWSRPTYYVFMPSKHFRGHEDGSARSVYLLNRVNLSNEFLEDLGRLRSETMGIGNQIGELVVMKKRFGRREFLLKMPSAVGPVDLIRTALEKTFGITVR